MIKKWVRNHKLRGKNPGRIKLLIVDVDGVLTDGRIIYDNDGKDYRVFHVHDGYGIKKAKSAGIEVAFISGRLSPAVAKRAQELGVAEVYQNVNDKPKIMEVLVKKYEVDARDVCAIGDDILDLALLGEVGFPVAVRNAVPELKRIAWYVTKLQGGNGAVREVVDLILRHRCTQMNPVRSST